MLMHDREDAIVFIHDFSRDYYQDLTLQLFDLVGMCCLFDEFHNSTASSGRLAALRPKPDAMEQLADFLDHAPTWW
jgi:hypothetical protein